MTFLSREPLECDEPLLQAMTTLGRQIGLFAERRRAEAELTQVNARLNAVLDASTQVVDHRHRPRGDDHRLQPRRRADARLRGREMVGKTTPMLIHDPDEVEAHAARLSAEFGTTIEGFDTFVERARRGGHDVGEWTYIRKDGTRLTVLLAVTAVVDPEGRINGFLGIATDLTDAPARGARSCDPARPGSAAWSRPTSSASSSATWAATSPTPTTPSWRWSATPGPEMVAGRAALGRADPRLLASRSSSGAGSSSKRRGCCTPFELECRRKDGQGLPRPPGRRPARREPARPARFAGRGLLPRPLGTKAAGGRASQHASELAEADTRKNEFLAMLGHELRNPLAPIRNAVKIMKQRGSDDPALCWARDVIDRQVQQMAQLVDDLLEISRVTRGKVRLQKEVVDVATIVAYAVETSRPIIDAHRHRLSIALPSAAAHGRGRPVRLAQVLSNLLNNAAKYTEEGGQIRLAVRLEGDQVVFRVRDNGIGIPAEMLSSVFDLFTQVDRSLDRSQGGLGLGLTLVRSLVEMHGGTVQADERRAGQGERVHRPAPGLASRRNDRQAPAALRGRCRSGRCRRPARPAPSAGRKVLVVDDNVTWAQSLALLLSAGGARGPGRPRRPVGAGSH